MAAAGTWLSEAPSVSLSVLAHGLLLLVLSLNLSFFDSSPDRPVRLAIDAATMGMQRIQRETQGSLRPDMVTRTLFDEGLGELKRTLERIGDRGNAAKLEEAQLEPAAPAASADAKSTSHS